MSWLADHYTHRAFAAAVLVGTMAGAIGVHVVLRRLSFFTQAMTHATFPGVVLASLLGVNLYLGGSLFGLLIVFAVAWLSRQRTQDISTVVGVVLAASFALGVVLLSAQDGFSRDLSAYLVGSILTVQMEDLTIIAVVLAVVLGVLFLLRKELLLAAFDPDMLRAQGYPALALDIVMLTLIELTIVVAVPVVGTVLSVALIVGPAAAARLWCDSMRNTMLVSMSLGIGSGVIGLVLSQWANIAAGAAIVLVAVFAFGLSLVIAPRHGILARRLGKRNVVRAAS